MNLNIYCDESCHLPFDGELVMVLGAITVADERLAEVTARLREIKQAHGLAPSAELKWGKVSPAYLPLYLAVIDYFFDDDDISFRAVVASKVSLDHKAFNTDHDGWYYRMYYLLLSNLIVTQNQYRVYLDIKDTRGGPKVAELHQILCNGAYDFGQSSLTRIQTVRSHEVQALQLADVLAGAIGYVNRDLATSDAKLKLIARIAERSGKDLQRSTPPREPKFNLFHWSGSAPNG